MEITKDMTVNEAIRVRPEAVRVFGSLGIDACCGGSLPIAEAARRHGLELAGILESLNGSTVVPTATDDPAGPTGSLRRSSRGSP